jgi:hypothetical protein
MVCMYNHQQAGHYNGVGSGWGYWAECVYFETLRRCRSDALPSYEEFTRI